MKDVRVVYKTLYLLCTNHATHRKCLCNEARPAEKKEGKEASNKKLHSKLEAKGWQEKKKNTWQQQGTDGMATQIQSNGATRGGISVLAQV